MDTHALKKHLKLIRKLQVLKQKHPCLCNAMSTEGLFHLYKRSLAANKIIRKCRPKPRYAMNLKLKEVLEMGFLPKTIPSNNDTCYRTTLRARQRTQRLCSFYGEKIAMNLFDENLLWYTHMRLKFWYQYGIEGMRTPTIDLADLKALRRLVYTYQTLCNVNEDDRILHNFNWRWRYIFKDRVEFWDDAKHPYNRILIDNYKTRRYQRYTKGLHLAPTIKDRIDK